MEVRAWRLATGLPAFGASGKWVFHLAVSNIEEVVAHVEKLGIDATQRSSGAKVKTLMIVDPDGNHIAFAEAIDKSIAR